MHSSSTKRFFKITKGLIYSNANLTCRRMLQPASYYKPPLHRSSFLSTLSQEGRLKQNGTRTSSNEHLLGADIVRRIKAELVEADANNDGKIDAEELKTILKKHSKTFTDEEIVNLSDLFYVAKAGSAISHEDFINAIERVAQDSNSNITDIRHRRTQLNRQHPLGLSQCGTEFMNGKSPVYSAEDLDIKLTHLQPKTTLDRLAHFAVQIVRFCFDTVSLWKFGEITQDKVFRRVIFLETVAAIPGFVAAMVRHFKSIRTFSRDGGMLQMFLDEANNERMHLLTFVKMRNPGYLTRALVLVSQTIIGSAFFVLYNVSPRLCHRFVGYIEEEACHTYTDIIKCIEDSPEGHEMARWRTEIAPSIARSYWHLGENGTVLEMMYAIRADEAEHRDVNHVCSGIEDGQINPLYNPQDEFDKMLRKYVSDMMMKGKMEH